MLSDPLNEYGLRGAYKMAGNYLKGSGLPQLPDFDTFAEIYGKMAINGFEICDEWGHNR